MDSYRIICAFVTGALLCLAMLLVFLRVPMALEWQSFRKAKGYSALACFVLSAAYGSSALTGWTFDTPVMIVWFVVASLQAILFTFTCVAFVAPQTAMRRPILFSLSPLPVLTALVAGAYFVTSHWSVALLVAAVVCYLIQLLFYTRYFISVYRANLEHLEEVYADDLSSRLSWVKRLFVSALVVGLLAVAVILLVNQTLDAAFGLVVAVYYTYVAISFINYMSRAAFVVKATIKREKSDARISFSEREWARPQAKATIKREESDARISFSEREWARPKDKAATFPEESEVEETTAEAATTEAAAGSDDSLDHVRLAIEDWVIAKRYLEPDVSVEEIARQMGISRQALSDYFSSELKIPFRTWRIEQRIAEAQCLLADDPSIPTGELCAHCGYKDRSNFHKHFLKVTGQTLAEYRSALRGDSSRTHTPQFHGQTRGPAPTVRSKAL